MTAPRETLDAQPAALELFAPNEAEHFRRYAIQAAAFVRELSVRPITNAATAAGAHNLRAEAKRAAKHIDLIRTAQVAPLNEQVKAINSAWRPITGALTEFDRLVARALLAWQQAEQERIARDQETARRTAQEAAQRQAEAEARALVADTPEARHEALEEAQAATVDLMTARVSEPRDAPTGIRTEHGTSWITERWVFQVVDPSAVPREFMSVDERKIRAAVAAGARGIPGVAIYAGQSLATRIE